MRWVWHHPNLGGVTDFIYQKLHDQFLPNLLYKILFLILQLLISSDDIMNLRRFARLYATYITLKFRELISS